MTFDGMMLQTEDEDMKLADISVAPTKGPNVSAIGNLGALMASAMADQAADPQSILEEHCSRIWDNSNGQTPSRSPGRSPDRASRRAAQLANTSAPSLFSKSMIHHGHKRKDKEMHVSASMLSFDSGVGPEDKASGVHTDPDSSLYRHHHHYHLHKPRYEGDTPRRIPAYHLDPNTSWEDPNRSRSRDPTKRPSTKKSSSDSSNNIDSGVSVYDASPVQVPNIHHPTNEK